MLLLCAACEEEVLRYRKLPEPLPPPVGPQSVPPVVTCDKEPPKEADVPRDGSKCVMPEAVTERPDPWNIVIEWQWKDAEVINAPMVAHLTDTNKDKKIDEKDTPSIAFTSYANELVVLDGKTGKPVWKKQGFASWDGVTIADLDNDGVPELIAFDTMQRIAALHADGTSYWTSTSQASTTAPQAMAADIDGDGKPEVVADHFILNGQTGAQLADIPVDSSIPYRMPAIGDLDRDGEQEVILGDVCYSLKKGVKWRSPLKGGYGHWAAILQYNKDDKGEVAMVAAGSYAVYDADGKELLKIPAGSTQPGPPCVADFDGDGSANIAWASSSKFTMRTLDGKEVWTMPVQDQSGLAACSGYDFNGDGVYELLFADEVSLQIFDGKTGVVRHKTTGHSSGTLWEYPVVADIDLDGSAELLVASNSNFSGAADHWVGITALGQAKNQWLKSGTVWPTHDFAMTNTIGNGKIPKNPAPSWLGYGVYRARPATDTIGADLAATVDDACWTKCDAGGKLRLIAVVSNLGAVQSAPDTKVRLYAFRGNDAPESLMELVVKDPIPAGKSAAGLVFEVDAAKVGDRSLRVVADALAEQPECNEENNAVEWKSNPCLK